MTPAPIRILLSGCSGRMGKVIERLAKDDPRLVIAAGSDVRIPEDSTYPYVKDLAQLDVDYDVLVDFSHPSAFDAVMAVTQRTGKPAVLCTTGLSEEQNERIRTLSGQFPLFRSANMSLGINLLVSLAKKATAALYPGFDIEIIEAHHNQKVDAPSGTAYMLADAVKEARDAVSDESASFVYERHSRRQKREPAEIGIHAIRGGSIVGEHDVLFAGQDEVIRLSHAASSRDVFARGALAAAVFMAGKGPGLYTMTDVIGED